MTDTPRIFIDADACPVKEEALAVAYRHNLKLFIVSNQWLRLEVGPNIEKVVVPEGPDVADDWIADRCGPGDIVITQDIPLASKALESGAMAIGNTGKPFTPDNIGMALAMRDLKSHLRETGEGGSYNRPFNKADRSRFKEALESAVVKLKA